MAICTPLSSVPALAEDLDSWGGKRELTEEAHNVGVEVKGQQGLRKLPKKGLEDDCRQVQLVVLVKVHWQPCMQEERMREHQANPEASKPL